MGLTLASVENADESVDIGHKLFLERAAEAPSIAVGSSPAAREDDGNPEHAVITHQGSTGK